MENKIELIYPFVDHINPRKIQEDEEKQEWHHTSIYPNKRELNTKNADRKQEMKLTNQHGKKHQQEFCISTFIVVLGSG